MSSSKKKIIILASLFSFSLLALLMIAIFADMIIASIATNRAILSSKDHDLWGIIPGRSEVKIYKDNYFYNIENAFDMLFKGRKGNYTELGPYRVQQLIDWKDPVYLDDNKTISYKYFSYHNSIEKDKIKAEEYVHTINAVALGVWYQAKNASPAQVALKALYSIVKGLQVDFYYSFFQQVITQVYAATFENFSEIFDKFSYWPKDKLIQMYSDEQIGFKL